MLGCDSLFFFYLLLFFMKRTFVAEAKAKSPINIALIKYWGKSDEENILPLNNSFSVTLDMTQLFTMTYISLWKVETDSNEIGLKITLKINGE